MKKTILLMGLLGLFFSHLLCAARWPEKEFKGLDISVKFENFNDQLANGDPVFFAGNTLIYVVTIKNKSFRNYPKFESQTSLHWAGATTCVRKKKGGRSFGYIEGEPLPGNFKSGLRSIPIRKRRSISYVVEYPISPKACPGQGQIWIEGRNPGQGGWTEIASFRLPARFHIAK